MFISNRLKEVRSYFKNKLKDSFESREIEVFFEWTCSALFNINRTDILLGEKKLSESELIQLGFVVKQLQANVPIQYVLGESHFHGHIFTVNKDVLIPRPETEELVQYLIEKKISGRVLDIGTGSGIIPISLKLALHTIEAFGLDVSAKALEIASLNANRLHAEVSFWQGDIMSDELKGEQFDVVISNPPYVLESDKSQMEPNVLEHEPHLALFVPDEDPLKFYRRIVELSREILLTNGRIAFEVHEKYALGVANLLAANFIEIEVIKDFQGKERIVTAIKKPSA